MYREDLSLTSRVPRLCNESLVLSVVILAMGKVHLPKKKRKAICSAKLSLKRERMLMM